MCNHCDCSLGMQDHCSILGSMPIGFCCENCIRYENRMTCENYIKYAARNVAASPNHLKIVSESETAQKGKQKADTVTLIINKNR
jgi:hypothetical protein